MATAVTRATGQKNAHSQVRALELRKMEAKGGDENAVTPCLVQCTEAKEMGGQDRGYLAEGMNGWDAVVEWNVSVHAMSQGRQSGRERNGHEEFRRQWRKMAAQALTHPPDRPARSLSTTERLHRRKTRERAVQRSRISRISALTRGD